MAWLVVLGEGSWGYTYERTWEPGGWQPPGDAPLGDDGKPQSGRWAYRSTTFRAADSPYQVDEEVAAAARATGYEWLYVEDEEAAPQVTREQPSGEMTPEDWKQGTDIGTRIVVPDKPEVDEPEPGDKPEVDKPPTDVEAFSALLHGCPLCEGKFPTHARLDRHIEFHHPEAWGRDMSEVVAAQKRIQAERDELRRLEDSMGPIRPEDAEALEQVGVPQPPTG